MAVAHATATFSYWERRFKISSRMASATSALLIKVAGAGFGVDTNVVTFITPDGTRELPLMSKADVADAILDEILKRRSL